MDAALAERNQKLYKDLVALATKWRSAGDLRHIFPTLHASICQGILEEARRGRYQQPDWILRLNNRFVERFFEAVNLWESGQPDKLAQAWKMAFTEAAEIQKNPGRDGFDPRIAPDRIALLFAGAHIFNDISLSLREVGCGPKDDFAKVLDVINRSEAAYMGAVQHMVRRMAAAMGHQGANSIHEWRTKVWQTECPELPEPEANTSGPGPITGPR